MPDFLNGIAGYGLDFSFINVYALFAKLALKLAVPAPYRVIAFKDLVTPTVKNSQGNFGKPIA